MHRTNGIPSRLLPIVARSAAVAALLLGWTHTSTAGYLSVAPGLAVDPGETVTVAVELIADAGDVTFQAVDIALGFDTDVFTLSNVRAGVLTGATSGFSGTFNTNVPGEINATQSGPNPVTLAAGTRSSVLLFDLTARSSASTGLSTINLMAQGAFVTTALDEGSVVLSPIPTNSPLDLGVDGVVTVGVVPEPGSLLLLGLGGALACVTCRRIRRA